ncbi:MAG: hypothetical protein ACRDDH_18975 [Cetobacterium sp.]|uniref:hypothetical protein n=1 Tax=Cetobacterium sp. TaxID=2071632 RepID=UPI003EE535D7
MNPRRNLVIKDFKSILLSLVICVVGAIIFGNGLEARAQNDKILLFLIGIIIFIIGVIRTRVEFSGINIDVENDEISFPGGAVTFNSIGQTLANLNQYFKRYTHKISSIHYITANNKSSVNKDGKITYTYQLTFMSTSGTVTLSFTNSAQRDQVYSIIVNLNDMGIPVQNR